jgi:hypothetical protein
MPDYKNSKIYKIIAEGYDPYIGSTTLTLDNRLKAFRNSKKYYSCSNFVKFGIIELIEDYPCETRKELMERERFWIDNTTCVNINKPMRTDLEKVEYHKTYNKEYHKTYILPLTHKKTTKEKNAEYCKRWYLKNRSKFNM